MSAAPEIAVVIAAYAPGDGFDRVMASLDAQTLPHERFEIIVVDDGSPDDTFERLTALAYTRPNMRVERIENSGWASRPRNVGTDLAAAPYVLYMDHDDALFPDALRRLAEYAQQTGADVVSTKEALTKGVWWGTLPLRHGNVVNVVPDGDIHALMPMMPHKLFRTAFLREHGIRFPEGRRQLWEDIFFNVAAWRHAERIAVLADTPVYLWHSTESNNSSTYGPSGPEFWDRIRVLYEYLETTLDGEDFARARKDEYLHQWRSRALKRFTKLAGTDEVGERVARSLPRAQAVQSRWIPEELEPELGVQAWPRSVLTRSGETDLLGRLWRLEESLKASVRATEPRWVDNVLEFEVEARWVDADGESVRAIRDGDRLRRDLPPEILAALPPAAVDLADTLDTFELRIGLHSRAKHVTWEVPVPRDVTWEELDADAVTPVARGTVRVDPRTAAVGRPLEPALWELSGIVHWSDASVSQGVKVRTKALPALSGGRAAVAFTNKAGTLALDLVGSARNVVGDGGLLSGPVDGSVRAFSLPLPRVASSGRHAVPVQVRFERVGKAGDAVNVRGTLHADRGRVRLEAGGAVGAGDYRLAFRTQGGVVRYGRWVASVAGDGRMSIRDKRLPPPQPAPRLKTARRMLSGLRRRLPTR